MCIKYDDVFKCPTYKEFFPSRNIPKEHPCGKCGYNLKFSK